MTAPHRNNCLAQVGTHIDSFFEYLLKGHIALGDDIDALAFAGLHRAVLRHMRLGAWYVDVHMKSGNLSFAHVNSLQVRRSSPS